MGTNICNKCLVEQDVKNFYVRKTRNNQLLNTCKECMSKKSAKVVVEIPNLEGEIWKGIDGYEGIYMVSNLARVKRIMGRKNPDCTLINNTYHPSGYVHISLTNKGKGKCFRLHRLVAIAFIPNPENKPEVNHIGIDENGKQGNKLDNRAVSLVWSTSKENINHAWKNGLSKAKKGESNYRAKFTDKIVLEIRELANKITCAEISIIYNIPSNQIRRIIKRERWNHI